MSQKQYNRIALLGKKSGMSHIFDENNKLQPVTVISFNKNCIVGNRTIDKDGYSGLIVGTEPCKISKTGIPKKLNKPAIGFLKKNKIEDLYTKTFEVRLDAVDEKYQIGNELSLELFKQNDLVDVRSRSKGKGFAGTVKRYGFKTQDATHGNSLSHRVQGSTGQRQTPGRVFPGKKMPGRLGNEMVSIKRLRVLQVDSKNNLLVIRGSVPGAPNGWVLVRPSRPNAIKQTRALS